MNNVSRSGAIAKIAAIFQIAFWPDRPWMKGASTVRAYVFQNLIDTVLAKSAFKTADHCIS